MWDSQYALNRFYASQGGSGAATAYVYDYWEEGGSYFTYGVYTDQNTKPYWKISKNEKEIILIPYPGWRNNTFQLEGSISAGSYVWFGGGADWWTTRFDYGGLCYKFWLDEEMYGDDGVEDPFHPLAPWIYQDEIGDPFNYIFSWYFTYAGSQNYTRTLTQGIKLTDARKLTADYKKTLTMNGENSTALGHGSSYVRAHTAQVKGTDAALWLRGVYRTISETIKILNPLNYCRDFLRRILETPRAFTDTARRVENKRTVFTNGGGSDGIIRERGFFRSVLAVVKGSDTNNTLISLMRNIAEWVSAFDTAGHLGDYVRGLFVEAGNMAETGHKADYCRKQEDTVYTEGVSLRHLLIFIHLVTVGLVRDFLIRRFLKSNEELILKSCVCRELFLDSNIH
jgi:hypothetical protein